MEEQEKKEVKKTPKLKGRQADTILEEGWLTLKQYAKKYGLTRSKVFSLYTRDKLTYKKLSDGYTTILVLDVPLTMHNTNYEDRRAKSVITHFNGKDVSPKIIARRKKELKETYLPIFIEKAPPDRMAFSGEELIKLFDIYPPTLYRDWHGWGLKSRPIPEEYRKLNKDVHLVAKRLYFRTDIFRFFNGDWGGTETSPDDIILGVTEGTSALEGEYYNFKKATIYPPDGDGILKWMDDVGIMREDKRVNGWSRYIPWEKQREFIRNAFVLKENGDYKHNLIICSWPRGEGKTLAVAMLTLFRFFNRYGETINLSGNSKDQATFAHYDLCKKIILNTPKLKNTPGLVIKEKYIALMAGPKEPVSQIKAIPSSVGLLPGTTCAVFTELHNLEDRQFFVDLWTSIRGIPNAMVLVDTTVAEPGHIVYELWESYCKGEDSLLYFHHYADEHHNPEVTQEQLDSFKRHMLEHEYNRYFRNRWEDATGGLFTPNKIKEMGFMSIDGLRGPIPALAKACRGIIELEAKRNAHDKVNISIASIQEEIKSIERRMTLVDEAYKIPAMPEDIDKLSKIFGAGFIIGVGLDRSQMLGIGADRTVLTCVGRAIITSEISYYFILDMYMPTESTLPVLTNKLLEWTALYGWIDKIVIESYLGLDLHNWCLEKGFESELIPPSYKNQKPVFTEFYQLVEQGYLKCPKVPYYTDDDGNVYRGFTNKEDLFREEMKTFIAKSKYFGSPEKALKGGVKDDAVYSTAWAIYATQGETVPMGSRGASIGVGDAIINKDVVGEYN